MSSAIKTPAFQAKASNILNEDDSSIYSGGEWSFKNASAVARVTIKDDGNCIVTTTGANYITAGGTGGFVIQDANTGGRGLITVRASSGSFQGLQFSNLSGTQTGFGFLNSSTAQVGYVSNAGAWTFGSSSSGLDLSHFFNSGGSTTVQISAANAANKNAILTLECPGSNAGGLIYERATSRLIAYSQGGGAYLGPTGTSWQANSDERMKKNIKSLELGLEQIKALKPSRFDYNTDESEESARVGFIAQEVLPVLPHAVSVPEDSEQMMGVSATEMIPVLVKAIQELSAQVEELKAKLP